jgi:hypothetical protein
LTKLKEYITGKPDAVDDPWYRWGEWLFSVFRQWAASANTRRKNPADLIWRTIKQEMASKKTDQASEEQRNEKGR